MATFTCPDCKKKVSEKAEACPKCGRKFTPEEIEKLVMVEKKAAKGGCALLLIIVAIAYFFFRGGDDAKNAQQTTSAQDQQSLPVVAQVGKIGLKITPTELMNKINEFATSNGLQRPLKEIKKLDGSANDVNEGYRAYFSEDVILQVFAPKGSKNITSASIISVPKNDEVILDFVFSLGCLMAVFSPEMSASDRGTLLTQLVNDGAGQLNENKSVTKGDITYTFMSSDITGIMFFVENKNDK
jgi:hypothetical protein